MRRLIVLGLLSMPAVASAKAPAPVDALTCVAPGLQPFCGLPTTTAPASVAKTEPSIFSPYIDLLSSISRAIGSVMAPPAASTATVQRTSM